MILITYKWSILIQINTYKRAKSKRNRIIIRVKSNSILLPVRVWKPNVSGAIECLAVCMRVRARGCWRWTRTLDKDLMRHSSGAHLWADPRRLQLGRGRDLVVDMVAVAAPRDASRTTTTASRGGGGGGRRRRQTAKAVASAKHGAEWHETGGASQMQQHQRAEEDTPPIAVSLPESLHTFNFGRLKRVCLDHNFRLQVGFRQSPTLLSLELSLKLTGDVVLDDF
jgi:hypothetical protein